MSRLQTDMTRLQLRAAFRDTLGALVSDMPVQEDDSITVFGLTDFRPPRYVAITGAVQNGGRYPWREGMTLRDLLHYAGGLDDGAYLDRAEIARIPENRADGPAEEILSGGWYFATEVARVLDLRGVITPERGAAAIAGGVEE